MLSNLRLLERLAVRLILTALLPVLMFAVSGLLTSAAAQARNTSVTARTIVGVRAARGSGDTANTRPAVERGHALEHHDLSASAAPPEGIFDGCDLNTELPSCEQRLSVIAHGGLKVVVMNVGHSTEANLGAYATYAHGLGVSVMWELNDPGYWGDAWIGSSAAADNPQFAAACGCSDTTGVLDAMVTFLASLPGTYGYYAADDQSIGPRQTAGLRAYVSEIKSLAGGQMVMIGDDVGQGQSNASAGAVMGNQIYPEMTSNIANMGNNLAAWDMVRQQIGQAQQAADRNGQASAFVLQAFTFGDNLDDGEAVGACSANMSQQQCYRQLLYPSTQVQLELRNLVLERSHPRLILWYSFQGTYGQAGDDTYSIYPTGAVAQARWTGLVQAINAPVPAPYASAASAKARQHTAGGRSSHQVTHRHGGPGAVRADERGSHHGYSPNHGPGRKGSGHRHSGAGHLGRGHADHRASAHRHSGHDRHSYDHSGRVRTGHRAADHSGHAHRG